MVFLDKLFRVEVQQVWGLVTLLLPPRVEVPARGDLGGDTCVVEIEERVLRNHQTPASRLVLKLGGLFQLFHVVVEEVVVGIPLAFN